MTTSSPLFVVPPPASLELKSSSAEPPTPYTPESASTSSIHKPMEITELSSPSQPTETEMKLAAEDSEMGREERRQKGDDVGEGKIQTEMIVAPPSILPPSPPLTEFEEQRNSGDNNKGQASPHRLDEEDITYWRSSVNGSYHEDDLGYSTNEASLVDPKEGHIGTNMREGGVSRDRLSVPSARHELDHPLSPNAQPPSPPLWEVVDPPENNNSHLTPVGETFPGGVSSGRNMPKSLTSRPLIPHSSYYFAPPPIDSAYGTNPIGHIGIHHPREIIRIERDYTGGEVIQFSPVYPLEVEGRITPTQFLETINAMNEILISAHSLKHSFVENVLSFFTLQLSKLFITSHYEKEMRRLRGVIDDFNKRLYNPVGLNILWPQKVAFMFLEIEYY